MHEKPDGNGDEHENGRLRRNPKKLFLPEEEKGGREICEGIHAAGDSFSQPAK